MSICPICNTEYKPTGGKRQKYCSRTCFYVAISGHKSYVPMKRFTKACESCGKDFDTGGRLGRGSQRFCSTYCMYASRYKAGKKANQLSITDIAYLSGLFDGEGCAIIFKKRDGIQVRISISMTNKNIIEWVQNTTGVGNIVYRKSKNPDHADCWNWMCNAESAMSVCEQILEFAKVKYNQIKLLIETQQNLLKSDMKIKQDWKMEAYNKMKELNKRGPK